MPTAMELSGRAQVNMSANGAFNKEVSFNYFANGKLKDVPEYIKKGSNAVANLYDFQKSGRLNTLDSQELLVDKILSNESLIGNKNIREELYKIVNCDFDCSKGNTTEENKENDTYYREKAEARVKFLDACIKSEKMQNNELISGELGSFTSSICNGDQADFAIEFLTKNAVCDDKELFSKMRNLFNNNICPNLIGKVLGNEKLNEQIGSFTLYNIDGFRQNKADKAVEILDIYEKKYANSEAVTKHIAGILTESLNSGQENHIEVARQKMDEYLKQENATKK